MPPTNRIAATLAGIAMPPPEAGSASQVVVSLDTADQPTHFGSVLHEAESLKSTLREAHAKVSSLIAALKRQRRQSKLVQTTLASLKQLQTLDA